MLKKTIKEIVHEGKEGFVGFHRLNETYYENEEVNIRHVSSDLSKREAKITTEVAKLLYDRLEANSRLGKKEMKIPKSDVNRELNRIHKVIKAKLTKLSKK